MYIHLEFDRDKLHRYAQRGAPLVFEIAWEHDGRYYPAPNWADYGAVILVWWLHAIVELFEGTEKTDFLFMDGPYGLEARYQQTSGLVQLSPRGSDWEWTIPLNGVACAFIQAANTVHRELITVGVGVQERESLAYGVARIRNTILVKSDSEQSD